MYEFGLCCLFLADHHFPQAVSMSSHLDFLVGSAILLHIYDSEVTISEAETKQNRWKACKVRGSQNTGYEDCCYLLEYFAM
jgi:hypothetical protein